MCNVLRGQWKQFSSCNGANKSRHSSTISVVGRSRISYLPKMPVPLTENIHLSRCDMLSDDSTHQGIRDGPNKSSHRSTIVEQGFLVMSWSEKIYPYRRSQKHCKWNPVRKVIHYSNICTYQISCLKEHMFFKSFIPRRVLLQTIMKPQKGMSGGGGGVIYISDGKGRSPFSAWNKRLWTFGGKKFSGGLLLLGGGRVEQIFTWTFLTIFMPHHTFGGRGIADLVGGRFWRQLSVLA